jgi:hypothetical protein
MRFSTHLASKRNEMRNLMRKISTTLAIAAGVCLVATTASAQKVKLRDSNIKGHLTAGSCGNNVKASLCTIGVDVPEKADGRVEMWRGGLG